MHPSRSFLACLERPRRRDVVLLPGRHRSAREAENRGEARGGGKPIFTEAAAAPSGLDPVAQLPAAWPVAFPPVRTTGSEPSEALSDGWKEGSVLRGAATLALEERWGRRPSLWSTPPRGGPSLGHTAELKPKLNYSGFPCQKEKEKRTV